MTVQTGQNADAQDMIKQPHIYAADAGGSDTYAISLPVAPSAYADGLVVRFKANTANTGAATLNVNTLGAIAILRPSGDALITGDIVANQTLEVIYRGGSFYMLSPLARYPVMAHGQSSRTGTAASGSQTVAHGLGITPRMVIFHASAAIDTNENCHSDGSSDGTNNYYVFHATIEGTSSALTDLSGGGSTLCIVVVGAGGIGGGDGQSASAAFDATNITLTWTKISSGSNGDVYFHWVAYA